MDRMRTDAFRDFEDENRLIPFTGAGVVAVVGAGVGTGVAAADNEPRDVRTSTHRTHGHRQRVSQRLHVGNRRVHGGAEKIKA